MRRRECLLEREIGRQPGQMTVTNPGGSANSSPSLPLRKYNTASNAAFPSVLLDPTFICLLRDAFLPRCLSSRGIRPVSNTRNRNRPTIDENV